MQTPINIFPRASKNAVYTIPHPKPISRKSDLYAKRVAAGKIVEPLTYAKTEDMPVGMWSTLPKDVSRIILTYLPPGMWATLALISKEWHRWVYDESRVREWVEYVYYAFFRMTRVSIKSDAFHIHGSITAVMGPYKFSMTAGDYLVSQITFPPSCLKNEVYRRWIALAILGYRTQDIPALIPSVAKTFLDNKCFPIGYTIPVLREPMNKYLLSKQELFEAKEDLDGYEDLQRIMDSGLHQALIDEVIEDYEDYNETEEDSDEDGEFENDVDPFENKISLMVARGMGKNRDEVEKYILGLEKRIIVADQVMDGMAQQLAYMSVNKYKAGAINNVAINIQMEQRPYEKLEREIERHENYLKTLEKGYKP